MTCIGWLAVAAGLVRLLFARRASSAHPRHDWFGRDFAWGALAGPPGTGGGPDAYRRRAGYSPEAADFRLSRHRDRGGEAGPDRPGRPAAPARLAGAVSTSRAPARSPRFSSAPPSPPRARAVPFSSPWSRSRARLPAKNPAARS